MLRPSWGGTNKPYKKTDGDILSVRSQANDSFSNNKFNCYLIQMAVISIEQSIFASRLWALQAKRKTKKIQKNFNSLICSNSPFQNDLCLAH